MRFQNQVVIITGGAKGIGAGCVRVFHREGGTVAILDRDLKSAEALCANLNGCAKLNGCDELNGEEDRAFAIRCDVSEPEQIEQAIAAVASRCGRIDCLVNNAGIHPPATPIEQTSIADMESVMRINYLSTFAASRAVVPHLRKTRGSIVNISSMTAVLGQLHSTAYCATKAAQVGLTKSLAIELGPAGIRVNAILPSNVDTPLMRDWAASLPDPESALERVAALQVFGRMASPEEIGEIALFLATPASSFITGQAIEAEGGASLDY